MAIEFNCPYCTATIRVPDAYAGKQGRCPKCDTKLLIPTVLIPVHPGAADPANHTAPSQTLPNVVKSHDVTASPFQFDANQNPVPPSPNATAQNSSLEHAAPTNDPFAVRPVTTSMGRSRRRRVRRRPSRTLVMGVPVICFLVLFGIIAYSLTDSLPKLHGNLTARRMDGLMLPPTTIPWSDIGISASDRKILEQEFVIRPDSLTSQIISCRISANTDGIVVTLSSTPESEWVVVDTTQEKPLAIWRRKEGPHLNRFRLEEMQSAVTAYLRDKLMKANGQQIAIDGATVRDKVALNASGGALSYAVQAVVDSTIFPCAAEDGPGKLYFCLPKSVSSFLIQGRSLTNGDARFSGEYKVTISSDIVNAESEVTDKASPDSVEIQPDHTTQDSSMDDEKADMQDKNPDMTDAVPDMSKSDEKMMNERIE